jgi:tyrosinase
LTDVEKKAYIDAELCLMGKPPKLGVTGSQNLWDDLMYAHIYQAGVIHNDGPFLPWHRLYSMLFHIFLLDIMISFIGQQIVNIIAVRVHEIYLQTECGYTGAQPYWDEQADTDLASLADSAVFDPITGFGSGNLDANGCVADGPFVNLTMHLNQTSNNANFCLTRDFDQASFLIANRSNVDECMAIDNYTDAWNCWGTNPHLAGHMGVGGTVSENPDVDNENTMLTTNKMLDVVSSPGDPLFFTHHTNIDRLWWEWQSADIENRLYDIGGPVVATEAFLNMSNLAYPGADLLDYNGEVGNVTTLAHNLWTAGLVPNITIGDIMDLSNDMNCATYV